MADDPIGCVSVRGPRNTARIRGSPKVRRPHALGHGGAYARGVRERGLRQRVELLPVWLQRLVAIGALPSDSDELRARKGGLGVVLGADGGTVVRLGRQLRGARAVGLGLDPARLPGRYCGQPLHVRANAPLRPVPREPTGASAGVAVRAAVEPGRLRELVRCVSVGDHLADGGARLRGSPSGRPVVPGVRRARGVLGRHRSRPR